MGFWIKKPYSKVSSNAKVIKFNRSLYFFTQKIVTRGHTFCDKFVSPSNELCRVSFVFKGFYKKKFKCHRKTTTTTLQNPSHTQKRSVQMLPQLKPAEQLLKNTGNQCSRNFYCFLRLLKLSHT